MKGIPNTYGTAGALGAAWGLGEALGVLVHGHAFVDRPALLVLLAMLGPALLAVPAGRLAPERGWVGALVALCGVEVLLAVATDPPPFQEPAWYVGSVFALVLAAIVLTVSWSLLRRTPNRLGVVMAMLIVMWHLRPRVEPVVQQVGEPGASVLLVTLDTTRADHCSLLGYERPTTPALEALGQRGVVFESAWSPIAVTASAHASIFSGQGPWEHGVLLNGTPLPQLPWLPERLQGRGYRTGGFVSAYVLDGVYGFSRGFDTFDDDFGGVGGSRELLPMRLVAAFGRWRRPDAVIERRGDHTVDRALAWLEADAEPFFLWVHLFDAHGPYEAPEGPDFFAGTPDLSLEGLDSLPPYLEDSLVGLTDTRQVVAEYDRELHFADQQLARLLEAVGPDTVVLVAGDHGECLGEEGVWFDHGADLQDHSLRVPMVLAGPGVPVQRVTASMELGDAPALLEAAIEGRPLELEGGLVRSLAYDREANLRAREEDPGHRPSLRMAGVRGPEGLVVVHEEGAVYWTGEGDAPSERVEAARALLAGEPVERDLSDEETRRLRALGYLDGLP